LIFDGCPLANAAREELVAALEHCRVSDYEEIDILAQETPEELRGWGSPTILVDGVDITGEPKGDSVSCRVYPGSKGVPDRAIIVERISQQVLG
jgi:hypothetical protein